MSHWTGGLSQLTRSVRSAGASPFSPRCGRFRRAKDRTTNCALLARIRSLACCICWLTLVVGCVATVHADTLVYDTPEGRRTVDGKLTARTSVELLFLARDGRMHLIDTARVVDIREDEVQPKPLTRKELLAELRAEFGGRFDVFPTTHYLICYDTDPGF